MRLRGQRPGTFLVRAAESHSGFALSLVLVSGIVQHFKVWQDDQKKFRVSEGDAFVS